MASQRVDSATISCSRDRNVCVCVCCLHFFAPRRATFSCSGDRKVLRCLHFSRPKRRQNNVFLLQRAKSAALSAHFAPQASTVQRFRAPENEKWCTVSIWGAPSSDSVDFFVFRKAKHAVISALFAPEVSTAQQFRDPESAKSCNSFLHGRERCTEGVPKRGWKEGV